MSGEPSQNPEANQPGGELLLYQTEDGKIRVECRFEDGTLWLSQALIAELFQTSVQNASLHLKNIYAEGELSERATIKECLIVRLEGARQVSRKVLHYNLEAILAVGYRVNSRRGTQFRQWATARLEEYLRKGFTMDDERLKNPPGPGVPDYFDELLERIRGIRSSERRVYLRVRDIFALAADYDPRDEDVRFFYQVAQNKLHYAATGETGPELIAERADATKPNMGLTAWSGGFVRRKDVTVAKNYLTETEITEMNRIVTMFLDYAEDQAKRRKQVFLADWQAKLDDFLRFHERNVLPDAGHVSREQADKIADAEYEKFAAHRRALAETEGEKIIRELENTAKKLPKKT